MKLDMFLKNATATATGVFIKEQSATISHSLTDILPVLLRRHFISLLKTRGQVRRASEAAVEGDVGHGLVPGKQQLLRALQAEVLHVLHGRLSGLRPEDPGEVGWG